MLGNNTEEEGGEYEEEARVEDGSETDEKEEVAEGEAVDDASGELGNDRVSSSLDGIEDVGEEAERAEEEVVEEPADVLVEDADAEALAS